MRRGSAVPVPKSMLFKVKDRITDDELDALGIDPEDVATVHKEVYAMSTSVKRCPRKGEFYLSGAIPEAYRALEDLDTPHMLARLVRVEIEEVYRITHAIGIDVTPKETLAHRHFYQL